MKVFNPFDKSFDELIADDLIALRNVTEGWYVEYKQEVPNAASISKSVSALANSYGGWVFYGVKEESKENSVAGEFLGIDSSEVDTTLQRIRQSVSNSMNPACHYEARAIYGPSEMIGLDDSRAIICVTVPQSVEAPHVHSKGSIYRRIADGSEPVPETDRYMIEKLFQRSKDTLERYKSWIARDPELLEDECDSPYLRVMITPNPWGMPRPNFSLDVDSAREALNSIEGRAATVPFQTVYPSAGGIVARQSEGKDPTKPQLTWVLTRDLTSDIHIPLTWYRGNVEGIQDSLAGYNYCQEFVAQLKKAKVEKALVVDLNYVFNLLMAIVESQRALQNKAGWPLGFFLKVKLLNVRRAIPFLDVDYVIRHVDANGLPVCLTRECVSPLGNHPETFATIRDFPDMEDHRSRVTIQTLFAFMPIAEAFGIPLSHMMSCERSREGSEEKQEFFFDKLTDAGIRSIKMLTGR